MTGRLRALLARLPRPVYVTDPRAAVELAAHGRPGRLLLIVPHALARHIGGDR